MTALYQRARTGEGQFIDLAQMESAVALLGTDVIEYGANGTVPEPRGNRARDFAPHGAYRCWGDDRWVAIAVRTHEEWRALCGVMQRPDFADDPRLATVEGRQAHEDELDAAIAAWTARRDPWQVTHVLQAAAVMAGVVEDLADMVVRDPHLSTQHFERVSRGDEVTFTTHRQPVRLDGVSPELRVSPKMGEHNEEVFKGLLGVGEEEYAELLAEGVIH